MTEPRPLHRLFGLSWIDFFEGTNVDVKTETDLSVKQQFVDLILVRRGSEPLPRRLPDGFEDLGEHNLITFKSHQEALDGWALCELVGHYVNYRKQSSPSLQDLLPEADYRLFAVCARYPQLLAQETTLTPVAAGIYDVRQVTMPIRVVVVNQLPQTDHNAMLHLFSSKEELLRYGQKHYRQRSQETSLLLLTLLKTYKEDPDMPDKMKEFLRQSIAELLRSLPTEERLDGLPAEERLKGLPAEERLKGLSTEELLQALSPQALEELTRKLKANGSATKQ